MIDFDEIRKEIAIKHSVLLGPDDPVLVTVTLNDLVIARYVDVLTAQNEGHQKALSAALQEHVEQSKATGGKIITDASDYVSTQVRQAVTDALTEVRAQIRQDMAEARAATREASSAVRSTAIVAAVAAGFCALVAIAAMVAIFLN